MTRGSLARGFLSVAFTLVASVAQADDKDVCLDAHARSQILRKEGKFRSAEDALRTCSGSKCPPLVARDCARWVTELAAEQPTILVSATDEKGRETTEVRVLLDGQPIAARLDGLPVAVDPGEHLVRYESAEGSVHEERIVLLAKEKDRRLRVSFAKPLPPAPSPHEQAPHGRAPDRRAIPTASFISGGVALAAAGVWAFFGISGKLKESALSDRCAPHCSQSEIDGVSSRYLVADVAMAVTLVSAASALVLGLAARAPRNAVAKATASGARPAGPLLLQLLQRLLHGAKI